MVCNWEDPLVTRQNISTRNWGIPTKRLCTDGTAAAGIFLGKTSGVSVLHDNWSIWPVKTNKKRQFLLSNRKTAFGLTSRINNTIRIGWCQVVEKKKYENYENLNLGQWFTEHVMRWIKAEAIMIWNEFLLYIIGNKMGNIMWIESINDQINMQEKMQE